MDIECFKTWAEIGDNIKTSKVHIRGQGNIPNIIP